MNYQRANRNRNSFVNLPDYDSNTKFLENKIIPLLGDSSVVLDAGCGRWNRMLGSKKAKCVIGVDVEFNRVKDNSIINCGVVGNIQEQIFQEKVFDVIVSNDVAEHLSAPEKFIAVCYRLLKNSGHVIIAAPNKNSLFGLLAAMLPSHIMQCIFKIIFGKRNQNEVHYYRLNNEAEFRALLKINGFSKIDFTFLNKLGSRPSARVLWGWYYQLCKIPFMKKFSPGILCIAQKSEWLPASSKIEHHARQ